MFETEAQIIISYNIQNFVNQIDKACDTFYTAKEELNLYPSDFPLFYPAKHIFFDYQFLERLLECYIREYIITPTLCQLFVARGYCCRAANSPNDLPYEFAFCNNEQYTRLHPIAITIENEREKFGISYAEPYYETAQFHLSPYYEEAQFQKYLRKKDINRVVIIDWHSPKQKHSKDGKIYSVKYKYRKVYYMSLESLFHKYFSDDVFRNFSLKAIKAIQIDANRILGFDTIPDLSLRYLPEFKNFVLNEIAGFLKPNIVKPEYSFFSFLTDQHDYNKIIERLKKNNLINVLIGNEKFAKCFITSEYLYNVLGKGNNYSFDYTSIVTGYIKSVELLLEKIVVLALDCKKHEDLWIKSNCRESRAKKNNIVYQRNPDKKSIIQVKFISEYDQYFSKEMGALIWFVHDREDGWYISDDGKEEVHKCLINYNQTRRNGYFHKDIIEDFETVRNIRTDTIICLLLLLGGCKLTDHKDEDYRYFD